ncbi:hypothetical protein C8A01DRAFT_41362 [Parachaetomium inaequale]|uniref:Uncharacterized protein n=1 Tax=Parachaetomium inaequale TaxID=2588326 RepID=A0AAN6P7I2_9PEZI|nr:hypothetical protein C8A01DRAFT_41362 [Parachaetomium inaequale]
MNAAAFFQPPAGRYPELSDMVRREVEGLLRSGHPKMKQDSDCLFSNIQNYLELLLWLLPKLAERLLSGPHVAAYINAQIAEVNDETDFSDLDRVNTLCEQQLSLWSVLALPVCLAVDLVPRASQFSSHAAIDNVRPAAIVTRQQLRAIFLAPGSI